MLVHGASTSTPMIDQTADENNLTNEREHKRKPPSPA